MPHYAFDVSAGKYDGDDVNLKYVSDLTESLSVAIEMYRTKAAGYPVAFISVFEDAVYVTSFVPDTD